MKTLMVHASVACCIIGCSHRAEVPSGATVWYENELARTKVPVPQPLAGSILQRLGQEPDSAQRGTSMGLDSLRYLHVGNLTFEVVSDELILMDRWGLRIWRIKNIEARLDSLTGISTADPNAD